MSEMLEKGGVSAVRVRCKISSFDFLPVGTLGTVIANHGEDVRIHWDNGVDTVERAGSYHESAEAST